MKKTKKTLFPSVVFGFNYDWELKNWIDSSTKEMAFAQKKWGLGSIPFEIDVAIGKIRSEERLRREIKKIYDVFLKTAKAKRIMQGATKRAEKRWGEIGEICFSSLSKMLNVPLKDFEKEYQAYFTFGQRCPFGRSEFMFNQFSDFPNTAAHEIMHIEFLKKYKTYCAERELEEKQINNLKEILTVLLNEDLGELLYLPDRGYDSHREIRKKVLKMYRSHKKTKKPFVVFLDKIIKAVKN